MYERMLAKHVMPSIADMTAYCGETGSLFMLVNEWLSNTHITVQKIVFPCGNQYRWGVAHQKKNQLICNIFAENSAFTVMMRLSDKQIESVYSQVAQDTQRCLDDKYPCSNGGWIHYRIADKNNFDDLLKLLKVKCTV